MANIKALIKKNNAMNLEGVRECERETMIRGNLWDTACGLQWDSRYFESGITSIMIALLECLESLQSYGLLHRKNLYKEI